MENILMRITEFACQNHVCLKNISFLVSEKTKEKGRIICESFANEDDSKKTAQFILKNLKA